MRGSDAADFFSLATRGIYMSTSNNKLKKQGNGSPKPTPMEQSNDYTERSSDMELEETFNLDSDSLQGGPSVSSLILSLPTEEADSRTDPSPDPMTLSKDEGNPKSSEPQVKRLSQSKRRRLKQYLSKGLSHAEALERVLHPVEQPEQRDLPANKRQRSTETMSPNNSAKGPMTKKPRDHACAVPSAPQRSSGVTYRDIMEATNLAVTAADHLVSPLTPEQLKVVRDAILDHIAEQEASATRPKFRSCLFRRGYLQLACADQDTVRWLETTAPLLKPWEGAQLRVVHTKDLPKALKFIGYFQDSADTTNDKIIRLLQNQNDGFSTHTWRVCHRNITGKTVELMLEIDQESANLISAQSFLLNYKFGKARMRQVARCSTSTNAKGPVAPSVMVRAKNPSKGAPQPPVQRNSATGKREPPRTRRGSKREPLTKRTQSRKEQNSAGHSSVTRRLQLPKPAENGGPQTQTSLNTVGIRQPLPGSADPTNDGPEDEK